MPAARPINPPSLRRRRAACGATIADVARAARVSIATVSRVINDAPHRVGEAKIQRCQAGRGSNNRGARSPSLCLPIPF